MTQDEIIEMARQVGFEIDCCSLEWHKRITAFAKLVAAKVLSEQERNFCSRCGKRIKDLTTIHTCTPPQD